MVLCFSELNPFKIKYRERKPVMNECICNNCKNLKSHIQKEDGRIDEYSCEFDFPSPICQENCLEEKCTLSCPHYVMDSEEEASIVLCCLCGKELKQFSSGEDGESYCVECYLNQCK